MASLADQARARNLAAATAAGNQTAIANANKAISSAVTRGVSTVKPGTPVNTQPTNLNDITAPATSSSSPEVGNGTPAPANTSSTTNNKSTFNAGGNFAIPKFTYAQDTFGDVTKGSKTQNKTGIATVTQGVITDPTKIDTSKVNPSTYLWGDAAKQQEKASNGYITARNDTMAAYLYQKGIKDPQAILAELQKLPGYSSGTESDQVNTAQSLAARIGAFQDPAQGDQLQNNLDSIQKQYMAQADAIIKAGAIEDKYTNFNETKTEIDKVLQTAGNDRLLKNYQGMPSDKDIQEIAGKAGVTFDRAKQIMEGDGWATLIPQDSFKKEQETNYNRGIDDATTEKARALEDMTAQMEALRTNIHNQQKDVMDMAQRNIDAMSKMGALRGQSNTTAFTSGLVQVHADAVETVNRLEAELQAAENADAKSRGRLMADYQKNLTRAKEDLDMQWKDLNNQMGQNYSSIIDQYTGDALLGKLQDLNTQMLDAKVETLSKYTDAVAKANKLAGTDAESIAKHEKAIADIQKNNMQYLSANKGLALKSMTLGDLNSMYKNDEISLAQYRMLHERVKQIGGEDLSEYGDVNDTHLQSYQAAVANGATPNDAIKNVVKKDQTIKKPTINTPVVGSGTLTEKNKIEANKPQQFTKFDDAFKKIDQAETVSFNQKDKVALGYKKTESADKIKKDLATKYLKSKLPASPTVDQIYSKISTMENSLGESKKWGTKAVQDAFGTPKAIEYAYDVGFDKDLSDEGDLTKFSQGVIQLFKNYGKTPDEKTTMTYLEKAGIPGSWLGKGLRGKIWDKIQSLE